jgi:hypothetical protein
MQTTAGAFVPRTYSGRSARNSWTSSSARKTTNPGLVNGRAQPGTAGCIDLELGITPGTKLFTLRRLAVAVGQEEREPIVSARPPRSCRPFASNRLVSITNAFPSPITSLPGVARLAKQATLLRVDRDQSVIRWPGRYERESAGSVSPFGERPYQARGDREGIMGRNARVRHPVVVRRIRTAGGRLTRRRWREPAEPTLAASDAACFAAVVWAIGYADETAWIHVPGALDAAGNFAQERGVSPVPGLFFVGRSWQSCRASALLCGVGEDAATTVTSTKRFVAKNAGRDPALWSASTR